MLSADVEIVMMLLRHALNVSLTVLPFVKPEVGLSQSDF